MTNVVLQLIKLFSIEVPIRANPANGDYRSPADETTNIALGCHYPYFDVNSKINDIRGPCDF